MSAIAEKPNPKIVERSYEPYQVSVQEYVTFREQGFLIVRNLVPMTDAQELIDHMDNLLAGREIIPGVPPPSPEFTDEERLQYWLRIHMLHLLLPLHERMLLHPRILDVLEALIGPDVLALQSMLFFKQPGQPGQGYHQDSYYIPTFPDTLCGAWLALDKADEENGCLWVTTGSQNEPIYPDRDWPSGGDRALGDIMSVTGTSDTNEEANGLTPVARKYAGREVKAEVNPGDVVFFGGHVLHRSHQNRSQRFRRSFVGHYCHARSWVPWNNGQPYEGDSANHNHILARGRTHMPYAQPRFGTPCAANNPVTPKAGYVPTSMMPGSGDKLMLTPHGDGDHD